MKFADKIVEILNKDLIFKILFSVFAGLITFLAAYNLGDGWSIFYFVSVLAFYGFACFTLWSGLCGGRKTANILIFIAVIAELSSFYFGGAYMYFSSADDTWAVNICSVLNFISALCGICMAGMFIASIIFKKPIFKMIGVFGGAGYAGIKLINFIFVFIRVCGAGNGGNNLYWASIIEVLIQITAAALVVAVMTNIEKMVEIKDN